jgi:hypothetical protein
MNSPQDTADFAAVRQLLQRYITTWNAGQPSALKAHWDATLATPIYVAEEAPAMHDWAAIERYWAALDGIDVTSTVGEPTLQRLDVNAIAALYDMHWRVAFSAHSYWNKPIGGSVRVSVILVRRSAQWQVVNYVEAPYAAAVQVKHWLERDAQE